MTPVSSHLDLSLDFPFFLLALQRKMQSYSTGPGSAHTLLVLLAHFPSPVRGVTIHLHQDLAFFTGSKCPQALRIIVVTECTSGFRQ